MTQRAPSNVQTTLYYTPLRYAVNTGTHAHTHTRFVKSNENVSSSNLLELGIRGWYIKILPQMQTLAKPTRFINHLRRKHVCVCVCVCVCECVLLVCPWILLCYPPSGSDLYLPVIRCYLLPTHTHTVTAVQCSIKSWLFTPLMSTLPARNQRDSLMLRLRRHSRKRAMRGQEVWRKKNI